MRPLIATALLLAAAQAPAQPELLGAAATLFPGNDQLVITGEIVYQGRRGAGDALVVHAELPRAGATAAALASAPVEIGPFALAPGGEAPVEPGDVITVRVFERGRVATTQHLRVERPAAPRREPAAQAFELPEPEQPPLRRAGGVVIGYQMRDRSPAGPIAPVRGRGGRSLDIDYDVTVEVGGNFDASFTIR